jgi:hypothetical protein
MLEARIEEYFDREAVRRGGFTRKWGVNGEPDRVAFLPPRPGSTRGRFGLAEAKRPGEDLTALQARNLGVYRGLGFVAGKVASFADVDAFYQILDDMP